ncbi:class F sortase [Alkalicoccus halolimnae]|uniref:Class F sortase n=1 Tax=Alkalicoccus halolimnae TaxID=1667239 RepID=A0A5C7F4X8_9BACI|nr:class F sortase [Alkalicoccus halolimnae]TXF83341.1 class F sortase [Alkalicoccus halolimnae]
MIKKFLYLILSPLLIATVVVLGFVTTSAFFSSPTETAVLSERDDEMEADIRSEEQEKETGEFAEMHEFQSFEEARAMETASLTEPAREEIPRHLPETLTIPSIDVEGPVEEVGILDNGQMEVPDSAEGIGWFEPGVKPGEQGNAVLAGHVDSRTGPAVFYELDQMEAGDLMQVTDDKGEILTFEVTKVAKYDRKEAPIEDIFGASEGRHLNVITCTGTFNQEFGTHDDRLVVYSELVEEEASEAEELSLPEAPENTAVNGSSFSWHAVSDEDVVGYRVYEEQENGEFIQVDSVATYERKAYSSENVGEVRHYVTSVNEAGKESEASEMQ